MFVVNSLPTHTPLNLPIYQAVSFDAPVNQGGSTNPWIIRVLTHRDTIEPYVVKLFTKRQIEQQHAVAKEVYGNLLACEFELPVPDFALIEFGPEFMTTLSDEQLNRLKICHGGLKYGSALATDMAIFKQGLLPSFLKEYNLGTIFAFDNLVQNLDRGGLRDKPNLLINDDNFLLIDHEQTFPFADDVDADASVDWSFDATEWSKIYFAYHKHLLLPYLKELRKTAKLEAFDTFQEHLRHLDIRTIRQAARELERLGVSIGHVDRITNYLSETKARHTEFTNLLKTLIA
ncbi:hypothetical protein GCM10023189_39050 [Nibrella saemangeumensis]|uniref:HipA-like kinase domain-containing protein n=1 Tax=Nibrella saemangeumensis TaxID=1084526 RepID=A0ABP8N9U7_9BACT